MALFLPFRLEPSSSVGRKSVQIASCWAKLGIDVRGFVLEREESWDPPFVSLATGRGERRRQAMAVRLARAVEAWQPDAIYTRFSLFIPGLRRALGPAPLVEEVNTDDRAELPLWSTGAGLYHRATRRMAFARRAGYVFLTPELARLTGLCGPDVMSTVVANGADLASFEPLPAPGNPRPRALFLAGSRSTWQGIDKVPELASRCPSVDFDLVGVDHLPAPLPANLRLHPYLRGDDLRRVCSTADLAIGTLALHRKRMDEACPLKVREYLAFGIPTLVGYSDPDLTTLGPEWLLQIPNTEDNVVTSARAVEAFAHTCRGVRVPRSEIAHLSLETKERQRLAFIRQVMSAQDVTSSSG